MPRIDWNRLQTILVCLVLILVLLAALGWVLAQISHALLLFVLAAVLALVLAPLVDWGEHRGLPRWLAVLGTYLLFGAAFSIGVFLLISPLVSQAVQLSQALPGYVNTMDDSLQQAANQLQGTPVAGAIDAVQSQVLTALAGWSGRAVGGFVGLVGGFGGGIADTVLMLIISIYMLIGGRQIYDAVHRLVPASYRGAFVFAADSLAQVLGSYVRGQLLLAFLLGVVVTIGLTVLGIPYALLLGVLATILGLIPMLGSALSAVPALAVALTQPFPTVLWVLIFFVVVQNVQDQVLAPRIAGQSVGLHPLATMFALLAGAQLGGVLGAIFALPVAGFIWIVLVAVYRALKPAPSPASAADVPTGLAAAAEPASGSPPPPG